MFPGLRKNRPSLHSVREAVKHKPLLRFSSTVSQPYFQPWRHMQSFCFRLEALYCYCKFLPVLGYALQSLKSPLCLLYGHELDERQYLSCSSTSPSRREQWFQTFLSLTSENQHCSVPYWIQLYTHPYVSKHSLLFHQFPCTGHICLQPDPPTCLCTVLSALLAPRKKKQFGSAQPKSAQLQLGWALSHFAYNMGVTCKQDMLHQQELPSPRLLFLGSQQNLAEPSVRAPSPLKTTNKGQGWCFLEQK